MSTLEGEDHKKVRECQVTLMTLGVVDKGIGVQGSWRVHEIE